MLKFRNELISAKNYTDNIIKSMVDALIVVDPDGSIKTINKAMSDLLGYIGNELIDKPVATIFAEEDALFKGTGMKKLLEEGSIRNYDMTYQAKSGEKIPVSFSGSVMRQIACPNWDGPIKECPEFRKKGMHCEKIISIVGIARDIRGLKEMQEKLLRSEKMAVVGQLASSVAHELRNPLGVIKNAIYYLNMLELGKDNPDIKENMEIISSEIENSDKVISDLLEFSRIKQPALNLENINLIIKETLNRVRTPAGIKVVTELCENLPQIQVDALQIQQVFYNLASNAIQAMEKRGTLTVSSCVTHDETIAIAFKDTGCGIPKENLQKIFEPLFSTKAKGTGLGLSVVASLVEGNSGKLEVESEVGRGSIFTVKLPIK